MDIAIPHKHYDIEHLAAVAAEMAVMGAPSIRAVWLECHGIWAAIEGCHRLRAAAAMGMAPEIISVEYSDEEAPGAQDGLSIAEICDAAHLATILSF